MSLAMIFLAAIVICGIAGPNSAQGLNKIETVSGIVHYIYIFSEGGFWGIVGDDGKHYEPLYLPSELRRPRLKVELNLIIFDDRISMHLWGTPVEILDYKILH